MGVVNPEGQSVKKIVLDSAEIEGIIFVFNDLMDFTAKPTSEMLEGESVLREAISERVGYLKGILASQDLY